MKYFKLLLKLLWTSPASLVGILLISIVGAEKVFTGGGGALHVIRRRNLRWLVPDWTAAITWGVVVLYRRDQMSARVMFHELVHTRQALKFGPLWVLIYPLASLLAKLAGGHPYTDNVFEVAAYRKEEQLFGTRR